jgi:uncharacterized protein YciI
MLFLVYLEDTADNMRIREPLLKEHMAHIGRHIAAIKMAGPFMRDDGSGPAGGMLLVEAESKQQVIDIVDADPYNKAGLWPHVRIHVFKDLVNSWRQAG